VGSEAVVGTAFLDLEIRLLGEIKRGGEPWDWNRKLGTSLISDF